MKAVGVTENKRLEQESFKPSQLDMLAASLRLDVSDVESSMTALAKLLQSISPTGVKISSRKKGLFTKDTVIEEISVRLGDQIYTISNARSKGSIACSRSKIVRDIVIKTDELPMDKWAASLAQHVALEAEQSAQSREVINKLLGLS